MNSRKGYPTMDAVLVRALLAHQDDALPDDATAILLQWRPA
jgi:hypothetical protein